MSKLSQRILELIIFLCLDFSQAELRILAEVSGDKLLIKQFREAAEDPGNPLKDVHCQVGHTLTGWSVEKIKTDKNARKVVKNMQFGIVFGKGRDGMYEYVVHKIREIDGENADLTGITRKFVEAAYDEYFRKYTGVARYMAAQQEAVARDGAVESIFGFRRAIFEDDARSTFTGNQAINCVDFETEILTKRGWLNAKDLLKNDYCLTETGWQRPIRIARFPKYKGPVHVWKSRSFSAVSTPEHRWKVFNADVSEDQIWTSATMPKNSSYRIHRTIPEIPVKESHSDDFVALCGWVLTDGYFSSSNRTGVGVCQSKPETKAEIQKLMDRIGVTTGNESGQKYWYVGGLLGRSLRELFPRRLLTEGFVSSLSRRQARLLIDTMMKGDGSDGRRMGCGDCRNQNMATGREKADMFQMLCAWAGYATGVKTRIQKKPALIKKTGQLVVSKKPYRIVSIQKRTKAQIWKYQEKIGKGNGVWCPTFADDAAWVARRRGDTYITKNTPIQSAAHTLLLIALALIHLQPRTYNLLQTPVMEVHDALDFFTPLKDLPGAYKQGKQLMEHGVVEYTERYFKRKLKVPLIAEAEAGFALGSCFDYVGEPVDEWLPRWRAHHIATEIKGWAELEKV